jgi:3-isopropylmalate/(R)-2-methylmalate dehydratase small subunit
MGCLRAGGPIRSSYSTSRDSPARPYSSLVPTSEPARRGSTLSPRFADIFRGNAGKAGLLAAQVDEDIVNRLWALAEADPSMQVTVDLRTLRVHATDLTAPFAIDDYTRWRLLGGLDDIDVTMSHESGIAAYERSRPGWRPTTS